MTTHYTYTQIYRAEVTREMADSYRSDIGCCSWHDPPILLARSERNQSSENIRLIHEYLDRFPDQIVHVMDIVLQIGESVITW